MAVIIDGKSLAKKIRMELKEEVDKLKKKNIYHFSPPRHEV